MPDRPSVRGPACTRSPVVTAVRRGLGPALLGVIFLVAPWPASQDLDPLLKWLGAVLVALGLVIMVATARTLRAARTEEQTRETGDRSGTGSTR